MNALIKRREIFKHMDDIELLVEEILYISGDPMSTLFLVDDIKDRLQKIREKINHVANRHGAL
jgi:hypothetical protein